MNIYQCLLEHKLHNRKKIKNKNTGFALGGGHTVQYKDLVS